MISMTGTDRSCTLFIHLHVDDCIVGKQTAVDHRTGGVVDIASQINRGTCEIEAQVGFEEGLSGYAIWYKVNAIPGKNEI